METITSYCVGRRRTRRRRRHWRGTGRSFKSERKGRCDLENGKFEPRNFERPRRGRGGGGRGAGTAIFPAECSKCGENSRRAGWRATTTATLRGHLEILEAAGLKGFSSNGFAQVLGNRLQPGS